MLIDWPLAERVANAVAARAPQPAVTEVPALAASLPEIEDRIEATTGLRSRSGPASFAVVDRSAWISANLAGFRHLLAPLLERAESTIGRLGRQITSRVTAVEVGGLIGWMSGRVLGQYDLLVGHDDPASDAVYLVGPNIAGLERRFGFDPAPFRTWVLIHELTHRAQFTGVPWMRAHFTDLVARTLSLADTDPRAMLAAAVAAVRDPAGSRQRLREYGLAGVVASDQQRAVINEVAGLMSLLEGHGDVVMTRAAGPLVADAPRFERILQARRRRGTPITRAVQQLLGIEAKLNQYAAGERFIAAIEAAAGERAVDRCWASPDQLPSMDEIRDPQRWLARTGG